MKLPRPDWKAIRARLRERSFWAELSGLVSIFGVVAILAFIVSTRLIVRSADAVVVDDLVGRDAGDAAVWLAAHGLRAEIDHFEDNDQAAPLTVTFHDPEPGSEIRPGHVVRLVISRGAHNVPVPDVRNIYASQARLILERNGLATTEAIEVYDAAPPGIVLASAPAANAPVTAGTPVKLLVSRGPRPRTWITPDVTWSLYDSVVDLAAEMGVPLEIGQRMHAEDEPENVVLEQFPGPGTRLVEGSVLRITVNGDVGKPAVEGGADLVTLSVKVPRGYAMHALSVRVTRGGWTRTLFEDLVMPGERVRVVAAVLPGDRAVATLDGRDVLVRTF